MMHFVLLFVIFYLITIRVQEIETAIFEKYREEWQAHGAKEILCVRDCQAQAVSTLPPPLQLPKNAPLKFIRDTPKLGLCSQQNDQITPYCRNKVRGLELTTSNSGNLFYISLYNKLAVSFVETSNFDSNYTEVTRLDAAMCYYFNNYLYSWWEAQKTCRERGLELWKNSKLSIGTKQVASYLNSIVWLQRCLYKFEVWAGGTQQFSKGSSRSYDVGTGQCIVMSNWSSSTAATYSRPCSNTAAFLCEVPMRCIAMICSPSVSTRAPNARKSDISQIATSELPSKEGHFTTQSSLHEEQEPPVEEIQIRVETTTSADFTPLRLPSPPGAMTCSAKLGCKASDIQSAAMGRKAAPKLNPKIYTICGKRYYISNYPQNYEDSGKQCCSDKMQLAAASSVADFNCIMELYKMPKKPVKEGRLWLAGMGNSTEGYRWCTSMGWGMPFSGDESWLADEPREDQDTRCVVLELNKTDSTGLATVSCKTSLRYICEEYSPLKLQQDKDVKDSICPNSTCDFYAIRTAKNLRKIAPHLQPKINYFNQRFYYMGFTPKTFSKALLECCSDEMQLMNLDDPEEWEVLKQLITIEPRTGTRFWISGYVVPKKRMYRWCGNDSPVNTSLLTWLSNEHNLLMKAKDSNLCMGIEFTEKKPREPVGLFVSNCSVQFRYICEAEKCEVAGKKISTPQVKVARQLGCHGKCPTNTDCTKMITPNNDTTLLQTTSETSFNHHQICDKSYFLSSIQEDFKSAYERCSCFVKKYRPLIIKSVQEFYCLARFIEGLRGSSVWTSATSIDCKGNIGWCGSKTPLSREVEALSTGDKSSQGKCLALVSTSEQKIILSYENCSARFMALCELQESMP